MSGLIDPNARLSDALALDFLWQVPTTSEARRLVEKWWDVASKHVAHYGLAAARASES